LNTFKLLVLSPFKLYLTKYNFYGKKNLETINNYRIQSQTEN